VVVVGAVRAAGEVYRAFETAIHQEDDTRKPHGAHEPGLGAGEVLGLLQGHQFHVSGTDEVLHLHGIDLVITPQDGTHQLGFPVREGHAVQEELAGLGDGHAIVLGILHPCSLFHLANHTRRGEVIPLQLKSLSIFPGRQRRSFGFLNVGRVLARIAAEDGVFAATGQHVELVGEAATNGTAVGLHGTELHAQAGEDALVGVEHGPVLAVGAGIVRVEGVAVLHGELAAPHEAEPGPALVAELGLDLEKVHGQLFVAAHVLADDVGDHFLVGGSQTKL